MEQHETELRVTLLNSARVQLFGADNADSLRGMYFDDVVLDEYADMHPGVWPLVIRPALADRKGSALFIGTPKGRNAFHEMFEQAAVAPQWSRHMLKASESGLIDEDELAAARAELTPEQYEQEFECSFDAAIIGAYYGREIAEAERAGRIGDVSWDQALEVHTAWDLGVGANLAVWCWQIAPDGVRVIDYLEGEPSEGVQQMVQRLEGLPYRYGHDFVPHDAKAKEIGTGRTRVETLTALKRKPRLVASHKVEDGINALRVSFNRFWWDATKCKHGIEALRQYRTEYDEKKRVFRDTPRHDWTSHAADAARYMAMAWRELKAPRLEAKPEQHVLIAKPGGVIESNMSVRELIERKKRERAKRLYG